MDSKAVVNTLADTLAETEGKALVEILADVQTAGEAETSSVTLNKV